MCGPASFSSSVFASRSRVAYLRMIRTAISGFLRIISSNREPEIASSLQSARRRRRQRCAGHSSSTPISPKKSPFSRSREQCVSPRILLLDADAPFENDEHLGARGRPRGRSRCRRQRRVSTRGDVSWPWSPASVPDPPVDLKTAFMLPIRSFAHDRLVNVSVGLRVRARHDRPIGRSRLSPKWPNGISLRTGIACDPKEIRERGSRTPPAPPHRTLSTCRSSHRGRGQSTRQPEGGQHPVDPIRRLRDVLPEPDSVVDPEVERRAEERGGERETAAEENAPRPRPREARLRRRTPSQRSLAGQRSQSPSINFAARARRRNRY